MSRSFAYCVALLTSLAIGSAQASVITNGDFSRNASGFTAFPGYFGDVVAGNPTAASIGWQIGYGASGVGTTELPDACPWAPTSMGDVTSWAFLQGNAKLSQEISLVTGRKYEASFELAQSHFDDANAGRAAAIVQIADGVSAGLAGASYGADALNADAFQRFTFTFTALDAPSGHWYFEVYNTPTGDAPGLAISNISITALPVPEPCMSVMLLTGAAGIACYAWRKRK